MAKLNDGKLVFTITEPDETERQPETQTVVEEKAAEPAEAPKAEETVKSAAEPEKGKKAKKKKKNRSGLHWYSKFLIFVDICVFLCFGMAYGPWPGFRDWLVTTALSTTSHRYFAYVLYNEEMVKAVAEKNSLIQPEGKSDMDAIKFVENDHDVIPKDGYDRQILEREEGALYKVIELDEEGYSGFITVIYYPERLSLVMAQKPWGDTITEFASRTGARIATNAGGAKLYSNGNLYTKDNVIVDGKAIKNNKKAAQIIGMSWEGKLMLVSETADQAIAEGMKWGVQFGPFLILNGKSTQFSGNGGFGIHPRTAIGQRQDGIVLLLTIDGRGANGSNGISLPDLTAIFERYYCYNAANLDGGGSTMLAVEGKLHNNPTGWGYSGERYVYNAIVYK